MRAGKRGRWVLAIGLLLLLLALLLCLWNLEEDRRAGLRAREVTQQLVLQMPAPVPAILPRASRPETGEETDEAGLNAGDALDMPVLYAEETAYLGILAVPALELPVAAQWSEEQLRTSPCVHSGSYVTGDLTILGNNYRSQFSPLAHLPIGAQLCLTTADGQVLNYLVSNRETLSAQEVDRLTGRTGVDDWDLSLVTGGIDSASRCVLRCVRVSAPA